MSPLRKKRLGILLTVLAGLGLALFLLFKAFNENMMFFYSTSDVVAGKAPQDRPFRLGGLVENGSVKRHTDSLRVQFNVTDTLTSVVIIYDGILPDLFREGQGIIALGQLNTQGEFIATEVLAKHDENYMPPEVADSLHKAKQSEAQP